MGTLVLWLRSAWGNENKIKSLIGKTFYGNLTAWVSVWFECLLAVEEDGPSSCSVSTLGLSSWSSNPGSRGRGPLTPLSAGCLLSTVEAASDRMLRGLSTGGWPLSASNCCWAEEDAPAPDCPALAANIMRFRLDSYWCREGVEPDWKVPLPPSKDCWDMGPP